MKQRPNRASNRMRADRVRSATPEDSAQLARVHVDTWREAYRGIFPDDFLTSLDVDTRADWWASLLQSGATVFVADVGEVVGFCSPGPASDEGWGEIYSIYVLPGHWGSGLGHDLLEAGEAQLASLGFSRALLWVFDANHRARNFYEGHSWSLGKPLRIEEIAGVQVTEVRYEKDLGEPARR